MGWQYSIGVRNIPAVKTAVEAIDEDAWQRIDYPQEGEAQIAETVHGGRRLIVRRTRLLGAQAELWPNWRHFCLITNRTEEIVLVEAEHREHAVVEQVIADLKDQALAHFPSGDFNANGAWTVLAILAHNMLRWTQLLGLPDTTIRAARTLRRRLLAIPGRLTRHARGWTLHLPARWPWHGDYLSALTASARSPPPPDRGRAHRRRLDRSPPPRARTPPGADGARRLHRKRHRAPATRSHLPTTRAPPTEPPHPELIAPRHPDRWIRAKRWLPRR